MARIPRWRWQLNPLLVDGALAILLLLLIEAQADPLQRKAPLSIVIVLFETLPLTFRRRAPVTVLLVVGIALQAHLSAGYQNAFFDTFAGALALYSVAANRPRSISLWFLGFLPLLLAIALAIDWHNRGQVNVFDIPYNLLLLVSAWVLGDSLQTRRAYAAQQLEHERTILKEREERGRTALAEERTRIARELHDIVAHSVSVMVLQANAGETILGSRPELARENFAAIQSSGRQALTELRRLLGILRDDSDQASGRGPQPTLADVDQLAESARRSGVETTVNMDSDPGSLSEALQLQAYRVIQEALTNTLRHAGATHATVTIRCRPTSLEVEVVDDGQRRELLDTPGSAGHGLIGMQERVQLFGGELRVGPRLEGGFRVSAQFNVDGRAP